MWDRTTSERARRAEYGCSAMMFEWNSRFPKMVRPPAAQARANTFAEESTPLPWGPPIIHERSFTVLTELIGPTLRPPEGEGLHGTLPIPAVGIAMTRSTHVRDGCTPYQTFLPVSISADSVASSTERAGTMCRVSARGHAGGRAAA